MTDSEFTEINRVELAFRPASKSFIYAITSGLQPARNLLFRPLRNLFSRAVSDVLKGHGFTGCGKSHLSECFVSGHDFSRALSH